MLKTDIKELALKCGFKLKEQPDGTMDLNPYVYDFALELMKAALIPTGENIVERLREVASEIEEEIEELRNSKTID